MDDDYFAAPAATPSAGLSDQERSVVASSTAESWTNMTGAPHAFSPTARLGFMGSVRAGLQLLPVCWRVLALQPSILVVPFVVLVVSGFAVFGYVDAFGSVNALLGPNKYAAAVKCFPLLAVLWSTAVVGQAVVVVAATDDLDGHQRKIGAAWATACGQLPRLIFFGVVYAGERTLTSMLRGKRWSPGTIVADVVDSAWDFATYFTVPVLIYENLPVFAAVKRSGQLVRQRWGVQLTANAVMNITLSVIALPFEIVGILVMVKISVVLGVAILVVALLAANVLAGAMNGILSAALYRFATTGVIAPGFTAADLNAVFSRKTSRR